MSSCYEMEDKEEDDEDKLKESSGNEVRTLAIPEAFPACMDWRQIFNLPQEVRQHTVVALQLPELYTDKVKDVGPSMKILLSMLLATRPSLFLTMIYY